MYKSHLKKDMIANKLFMNSKDFFLSSMSEIRGIVKNNLDDYLQEFYEHYFAKIAEKKKIPLEEFDFKRYASDKKIKTANKANRLIASKESLFTNDYLSLIFESNLFVNDVLFFLNQNFEEDYKGIP